MRRLALSYVRTPAVADDVVGEAWLGVLNGLDRFEGRSSLKTWIYRIVAEHRAHARRPRGTEHAVLLVRDGRRAVGRPGRFVRDGSWSSPPEPWRAVLDAEARVVIDACHRRTPRAAAPGDRAPRHRGLELRRGS